MKIIGLTRIRNEQDIITETLDHMATFCDEVYVYDDCSNDLTVELCRNHPIVKDIVIGKHWDADRKKAEWQNRKAVLDLGKQHATPDDWFIYMDADERIEFDWALLKRLPKQIIGVKMKPFDYYITPSDVDKHYSEREYLGPEYRSILMIFRNLPTLDYSSPDQREVHLRSEGTVLEKGFVKHYGKAVSVKQWEQTCNYYSTYFPKYAKKWDARKGKAVHTQSSFGFPLIKWEQKHLGFPLTKEIEKHNIYENITYKPLA